MIFFNKEKKNEKKLAKQEKIELFEKEEAEYNEKLDNLEIELNLQLKDKHRKYWIEVLKALTPEENIKMFEKGFYESVDGYIFVTEKRVLISFYSRYGVAVKSIPLKHINFVSGSFGEIAITVGDLTDVKMLMGDAGRIANYISTAIL